MENGIGKKYTSKQLATRVNGGGQKPVPPEQTLNAFLKCMGPKIQRAIVRTYGSSQNRTYRTRSGTTPKLLDVTKHLFCSNHAISSAGCRTKYRSWTSLLIPYEKECSIPVSV
ncbi:hypothetical protein MKY29_08975 [Psychrobacillus sp. FSL K6-2365]|uniref:hypothetical protein n=1 Tax=Psychrobacillus TaxID=1221880 RepID=UPI0022B97F44|nr:hypothetical protein [Psychrobacillus psychrodurans]MCZ8539947.1 hypothetical protein [Psychrobacillus psychrodurans]